MQDPHIPVAEAVYANRTSPTHESLPVVTIAVIPPRHAHDIDWSNMIMCLKYGKTTKWLAAIDISINILNIIFVNMVYIFTLIFPFFGYYGAKYFHTFHTALYMFYCFTLSAIRICQLVVYATNTNNIRENYQGDKNTVYWILIPNAIIQICIACVVKKLYYGMRRLSREDLLLLSEWSLNARSRIYP